MSDVKKTIADPSRVGVGFYGAWFPGRHDPSVAAPPGTPVCPGLPYCAPAALGLDALRARIRSGGKLTALPIGDCRLAISDCRLLIGDCRLLMGS